LILIVGRKDETYYSRLEGTHPVELEYPSRTHSSESEFEVKREVLDSRHPFVVSTSYLILRYPSRLFLYSMVE